MLAVFALVGLGFSLFTMACGVSEGEMEVVTESAASIVGDATEMVAGQNIAKPNDPGVVNEVMFAVSASGFEGPDSTPSGWTRILLRNLGQKDHHMGLIRLGGGKTIVDLRTFIESESKARLPEWAVPFGGPADVVPGRTASVTQDLAEGRYALINYVLDEEYIARPSVEMLRSF